ncbi:MAG: DNA repair protein RecN, partial [Bacteroidota bacterium]|nr:DNA repair protein RecN [Bacteroidota bacterium]
MLKHLSIKNYALIHHLNMDFEKGFSVITGETGAGKSILLGALGLVLGNRADTSILLDKSKKCIVESHFNIHGYKLEPFFTAHELDYDELTVLRREISSQGKSRGFINDTPVKLNILKELGDKLVNIHSQHQTVTLNDFNFQLAVIDNYSAIQQDVLNYRALFLDYSRKLKQYNELLEKEKKSRNDQDYLQFQLEELEKARLKENEQENIEKELEILQHAEEIKTTLFSSIQALLNDEQNLLNQLSDIQMKLGKLADVHAGIKALQQRLQSTIIEIDDIAHELDRIDQGIQLDPGRIEDLNTRLDLIYQLQHKHRLQTVKELISLTQSVRDQINVIGSLGEQIQELEKEIESTRSQVSEEALRISSLRQNAIPEIEKEVLAVIDGLGMPGANIKIEHHQLEDFSRDGIDRVTFRFNANKGRELKEIAKIASGGELSRLMLAIKSLISSRNLLPTIIFDEIDAGVSGDIAGKAGKILKGMSGQMQVIVITHLPQIAGKADYHYMAYKDILDDQAVSNIRKLNEDG